MYSLIIIAYHVIALFYLASGCILLALPHIIEKKIILWFPYIGAMKSDRKIIGLNLILIGFMLLIIGGWLVEKNTIAILIAIVLSIWEIYHSIAYCWKRNDKLSAFYHFVLNISVVAFLFYTIFGASLIKHTDNPPQQNLASVFNSHDSNK